MIGAAGGGSVQPSGGGRPASADPGGRLPRSPGLTTAEDTGCPKSGRRVPGPRGGERGHWKRRRT